VEDVKKYLIKRIKMHYVVENGFQSSFTYSIYLFSMFDNCAIPFMVVKLREFWKIFVFCVIIGSRCNGGMIQV
jgi:hypothetical protein